MLQIEKNIIVIKYHARALYYELEGRFHVWPERYTCKLIHSYTYLKVGLATYDSNDMKWLRMNVIIIDANRR